MSNKDFFDVNDIDDETLAGWVRHAACGCGVCGSMIGVSLEGQRALVKGDEHPEPKKFMHALQLQERLDRIATFVTVRDHLSEKDLEKIYKLAKGD